MRTHTLVIGLLGLCLLAWAMEAPESGVDDVRPTWEVPIVPGGKAIQLNGTIQELRSQLLELNPDYDEHFPPKHGVGPDDGDGDGDGSPVKRDTAIECSAVTHDQHFNKHINEGIDYISRHAGQPFNAANTPNCQRISCSYHSAIWWCRSYQDKEVRLDNWKMVADVAREIFNKCTTKGRNWTGGHSTQGEWVVSIGSTSC